LAHFRGTLQPDGYAGFNGLYDRSKDPLIEAACGAHVRRKFFDMRPRPIERSKPTSTLEWSARRAIPIEANVHAQERRPKTLAPDTGIEVVGEAITTPCTAMKFSVPQAVPQTEKSI
jgi:hypothetical protein